MGFIGICDIAIPDHAAQPCQARPFQSFARPDGEGLRGPDAKNQG